MKKFISLLVAAVMLQTCFALPLSAAAENAGSAPQVMTEDAAATIETPAGSDIAINLSGSTGSATLTATLGKDLSAEQYRYIVITTYTDTSVLSVDLWNESAKDSVFTRSLSVPEGKSITRVTASYTSENIFAPATVYEEAYYKITRPNGTTPLTSGYVVAVEKTDNPDVQTSSRNGASVEPLSDFNQPLLEGKIDKDGVVKLALGSTASYTFYVYKDENTDFLYGEIEDVTSEHGAETAEAAITDEDAFFAIPNALYASAFISGSTIDKPQDVMPGDTVQISPKIDDPDEIAYVTYTTLDGEIVTVEADENGDFIFTMPEGIVGAITVKYKSVAGVVTDEWDNEHATVTLTGYESTGDSYYSGIEVGTKVVFTAVPDEDYELASMPMVIYNDGTDYYYREIEVSKEAADYTYSFIMPEFDAYIITDASEVSNDEPAHIDIYPFGKTTAIRGGSVYFEARAYDSDWNVTDNYKDISWHVEGNTNENTIINSKTGLLEIDRDEIASVLKVTATLTKKDDSTITSHATTVELNWGIDETYYKFAGPDGTPLTYGYVEAESSGVYIEPESFDTISVSPFALVAREVLKSEINEAGIAKLALYDEQYYAFSVYSDKSKKLLLGEIYDVTTDVYGSATEEDAIATGNAIQLPDKMTEDIVISGAALDPSVNVLPGDWVEVKPTLSSEEIASVTYIPLGWEISETVEKDEEGAYKFQMPEDGLYSVTVEYASAAPLNTNTIDNGTITVTNPQNVTKATVGSRVTFTVVPDDKSYVIDGLPSVTYIGEWGPMEVEVTNEQEANTYSFIMPAYEVIIDAEIVTFVDEAPDNIVISPEYPEVLKGGAYSGLYAQAKKGHTPVSEKYQGVTWGFLESTQNYKADGTTIDPATGAITVDDNETLSVLYVVATSKAEGCENVRGTAHVYITGYDMLYFKINGPDGNPLKNGYAAAEFAELRPMSFSTMPVTPFAAQPEPVLEGEIVDGYVQLALDSNVDYTLSIYSDSSKETLYYEYPSKISVNYGRASKEDNFGRYIIEIPNPVDDLTIITGSTITPGEYILPGTKVEIIPSIDDEVVSVSYTPDGGKPVEVKKDADGKYTFTMPAEFIYAITANYKNYAKAGVFESDEVEIKVTDPADTSKIQIGSKVTFTAKGKNGHVLDGSPEVIYFDGNIIESFEDYLVTVTEESEEDTYSFIMPAYEVMIGANTSEALPDNIVITPGDDEVLRGGTYSGFTVEARAGRTPVAEKYQGVTWSFDSTTDTYKSEGTTIDPATGEVTVAEDETLSALKVVATSAVSGRANVSGSADLYVVGYDMLYYRVQWSDGEPLESGYAVARYSGAMPMSFDNISITPFTAQEEPVLEGEIADGFVQLALPKYTYYKLYIYKDRTKTVYYGNQDIVREDGRLSREAEDFDAPIEIFEAIAADTIIEGAQISPDKHIVPGMTVEIIPTLGYDAVDSVTYTTAEQYDNPVEVKKNESGKYVFKMPATQFMQEIAVHYKNLAEIYIAEDEDSHFVAALTTPQTGNAAKFGTKVVFTVNPDNGYAVDGLPVAAYYDNGMKETEVTQEAENTYSFTMPESEVTINVNVKETSDEAPASIVIEPNGINNTVEIFTGDTKQFVATVYDGNGKITTQNGIKWSVPDSLLNTATITQNGLLTTAKDEFGEFTVTATSETAPAVSASVTVNPVLGYEQRFYKICRADGTPLKDAYIEVALSDSYGEPQSIGSINMSSLVSDYKYEGEINSDGIVSLTTEKDFLYKVYIRPTDREDITFAYIEDIVLYDYGYATVEEALQGSAEKTIVLPEAYDETFVMTGAHISPAKGLLSGDEAEIIPDITDDKILSVSYTYLDTYGLVKAAVSPNEDGRYFFEIPQDGILAVTAEYQKASGIKKNTDAITVTDNKTSAPIGSTVTFTVTPPGGQVLNGIPYVTYIDGENRYGVEVTKSEDTYSFTMPKYGVVIDALFAEEAESSAEPNTIIITPRFANMDGDYEYYNYEMTKGETRHFSAAVISDKGKIVPAKQGVTWSIKEADKAEGTTITQDGVLTIDENEGNDSITIVAASTENPEITAELPVYLSDAYANLYYKFTAPDGEPLESGYVVAEDNGPKPMSLNVTPTLSGNIENGYAQLALKYAYDYTLYVYSDDSMEYLMGSFSGISTHNGKETTDDEFGDYEMKLDGIDISEIPVYGAALKGPESGYLLPGDTVEIASIIDGKEIAEAYYLTGLEAMEVTQVEKNAEGKFVFRVPDNDTLVGVIAKYMDVAPIYFQKNEDYEIEMIEPANAEYAEIGSTVKFRVVPNNQEEYVIDLPVCYTLNDKWSDMPFLDDYFMNSTFYAEAEDEKNTYSFTMPEYGLSDIFVNGSALLSDGEPNSIEIFHLPSDYDIPSYYSYDTEVLKGSSSQFRAEVFDSHGNLTEKNAVTWSVTGAEHEDTYIDRFTGVLTVSEFETGNELEITAHSAISNLEKTISVNVYAGYEERYYRIIGLDGEPLAGAYVEALYVGRTSEIIPSSTGDEPVIHAYEIGMGVTDDDGYVKLALEEDFEAVYRFCVYDQKSEKDRTLIGFADDVNTYMGASSLDSDYDLPYIYLLPPESMVPLDLSYYSPSSIGEAANNGMDTAADGADTAKDGRRYSVKADVVKFEGAQDSGVNAGYYARMTFDDVKSPGEQPDSLMFALYTADGALKMINVCSMSEVKKNGEWITYLADAEDSSMDGAYVKYFIWDSVGTLKPLAETDKVNF